jgi:hypothetical protein
MNLRAMPVGSPMPDGSRAIGHTGPPGCGLGHEAHNLAPVKKITVRKPLTTDSETVDGNRGLSSRAVAPDRKKFQFYKHTDRMRDF